MSREFVNSYCATLPGTEVSDPWGGGHDAWKVGGKMFASVGAITPAVAVKTAGVEVADMLIEAGIAQRAKYMHASWIQLPWGTSEDELRVRILDSYKIIRSGLSKKLRASLPKIEGDI
jgi:predicted DNA-binding protein (MmcQ/YjbR family)